MEKFISKKEVMKYIDRVIDVPKQIKREAYQYILRNSSLMKDENGNVKINEREMQECLREWGYIHTVYVN
ncbi:hypothetical protein [Lachnospira multipara]|uniref:hypothetical protein n=1 Tax=Lachnospira multipara TaxID=28051 RepID=UPI000483B93F|nr:hypothetical protein [Lachnospira multipara]